MAATYTPSPWIHKKEVMEYLHICERTLQTLRSNGTLPYRRVGGIIYYHMKDLEELMERSRCVGVRKRKKQACTADAETGQNTIVNSR